MTYFSKLARAVAFVSLTVSSAVQAQDFFKGKSINIYSGYAAGAANDTEMRLVAHHIRNFIPGAPNFIPRNMPGAAGVLLGNFLYASAPQDGHSIGMPGRSGFLLPAAVGDASAKFDLTKFTWIGTGQPANLVLWMRKGAGVRSFEELQRSSKEIVVGGLTHGSSTTVLPLLMAKYMKSPIKVVAGYPGTAETMLALQRGEVDGHFAQAASVSPELITSGEIVPIIALFEGERGVPGLEKVITDTKFMAMFNLLTAPSRVGLALIGTPNMPPEAVAILRKAYADMASSKEYQDEARARGFATGAPVVGEELQKYIEKSLTNLPADVIKEYQSYSEPGR